MNRIPGSYAIPIHILHPSPGPVWPMADEYRYIRWTAPWELKVLSTNSPITRSRIRSDLRKPLCVFFM